MFAIASVVKSSGVGPKPPVVINKLLLKEISLTNKEYKVDKNIVEAILILDKIAKQKRKERENKGSINFNKKAVSFKLNEEKDP